MNRRKPINHGTIGGYRAHYRHGEQMCEPCRAAERKRHGHKAPQKQAVCGTRSGYSRHVQRGEETCPACRAVNAQDRRRVARTGLPDGDPRPAARQRQRLRQLRLPVRALQAGRGREKPATSSQAGRGVTALGRRRPAVPAHPLAAVPAATCARQLPNYPLGHGRNSDVVHALAGGFPVCWLTVRRVEPWAGTPPLRLCSYCARSLTGDVLGRFWKPTRAELGEMHLYAADQLVADVRARLADIRSAAIHDGSALVAVEQLPTYRATRAVPDAEPVPSLRTAVILGQLLDRLSPTPAAVEQARADAAERDRQRATDRTATSSLDRRLDLRAARQARKARR